MFYLLIFIAKGISDTVFYIRLVMLTILLGMGFWAYSQSPIVQWQKAFGGPKDDLPYAMTPTADGGFVIAGGIHANGGDVGGHHGGRDFWIIKINSVGQLVWQKTFGGSKDDWPSAITTTTDGGYVGAGTSASTDGDVSVNRGGFDVWVIKLNYAGSLMWQKTWGGTGDESAVAIQVTPAGNYLLAGYTDSNTNSI